MKNFFIAITFVMLLASLMLLSGCPGHCITVGGSYGDYAGNVEYCFDKAKSADAGGPVFEETRDTESDDTAETETFFGFSEEELREVLDVFGDFGSLENGDTLPPARRVRVLLEARRAENGD